jgi:hypothetical protein
MSATFAILSYKFKEKITFTDHKKSVISNIADDAIKLLQALLP